MRTVGKTFKKKAERLTKKDIVKILTEKGIEFDENATVEELKALISKE